MKLRDGLTVEVRRSGFASDAAKGFTGFPRLDVFDDTRPVLTAYAHPEHGIQAWLICWGISGPEYQDELTEAELAEIMGWRLPAAVEKAA